MSLKVPLKFWKRPHFLDTGGKSWPGNSLSISYTGHSYQFYWQNLNNYANVVLDYHHPINLELTYSKQSRGSSYSKADNHANLCVIPQMLFLAWFTLFFLLHDIKSVWLAEEATLACQHVLVRASYWLNKDGRHISTSSQCAKMKAKSPWYKHTILRWWRHLKPKRVR